MLPVEDSKLADRKLFLLARFSHAFAREILIPEIEANCAKYQVDPWLAANFQKYKLAGNSLYFHHDYAYADLPLGQEYELIARVSRGEIVPGSIVPCKATVLAFFSAYKTQPLPNASHGHHENSLIQFETGIPDPVYDLYEITAKPADMKRPAALCLCSFETLRASTAAGCTPPGFSPD